MTRIRWTEKAMERLKFIGAFKAKQDPAAAAAIITRMRYGALLVADQPEMGRKGRVAGTRELYFSDLPYSLAYRIDEYGVDILAVIPLDRRWPLAL